jgi:hypothetical protein
MRTCIIIIVGERENGGINVLLSFQMKIQFHLRKRFFNILFLAQESNNSVIIFS